MTPTRGDGRIGVLVPFTNTNLEPDLALMCPPGLSVHVARMGGYDEDEIPDAAQMQQLGASALDEPLTLLMGAKPDVVMYGCTSATLTHGPEFDRQLAETIRSRSAAATVTAAGSLIAALAAIGATRVGFASPYVPEINDMAVRFLEQMGVTIVARADVTERLSNDGQGALTPDQVFELGRRADDAKAEAVVLSCTDMRSVETIAQLETALGKPVITSNQAMMFQALGAIGHSAPIAGFGRLLDMPRQRA